MLIVVALIALAVVSGVAGAVIHGAFWLFILTVLFLGGAALVGRASARTSLR
jgi:hypothetical protein